MCKETHLAQIETNRYTVDEALTDAGEILAAWVSDALERGIDVPPPRPFEDVLRDPAAIAGMNEEGAMPILIPLVLNSGRPARAHISRDAGLLSAIDEAARRNGPTRPAFLATAARDKIASGR